uniref:Nucleolar protein 12 n=1 Tax=Neogobius melanostomus TaxID=47308 RepID=A0A8C6SAM9_9GOBI
MKHNKSNKNFSKKSQFKPGSKKRENKCIVTFDEKDRQEFLTGFHKRKVERRKAAVEEIKRKIKEEQIKVREERHKEYLKLLTERREALEDDEDELENAITATTESVQYDHPNHTVTVTTISDLDLTGSHLLDGVSNQINGESDHEETKEEGEEQKKTAPMPKKAGNPILNKKIRSLTASLNTFTAKKKKKGKQQGRGRLADKKVHEPEKKSKSGRTTKRQRRHRTGKKGPFND